MATSLGVGPDLVVTCASPRDPPVLSSTRPAPHRAVAAVIGAVHARLGSLTLVVAAYGIVARGVASRRAQAAAVDTGFPAIFNAV